jgi:hypothetical protein
MMPCCACSGKSGASSTSACWPRAHDRGAQDTTSKAALGTTEAPPRRSRANVRAPWLCRCRKTERAEPPEHKRMIIAIARSTGRLTEVASSPRSRSRSKRLSDRRQFVGGR